jgi:hypothetical protein
VRTDRYRAVITSPEFGAYAHGQPQVVSGYVSAKVDEGLPTETNIVSVTINGVAGQAHRGQRVRERAAAGLAGPTPRSARG